MSKQDSDDQEDLFEPSAQSKGGKARAEKMTKEQRSDIAKRAAQARWAKQENLPLAPYTGTFKIGEKEIPCANLEDGTPLITTRGIMTAMGRPWRGTYQTQDRTEMPNFLAAVNLKPFINQELREQLVPVRYMTKSGGIQEGYEATILRKVCNVYLAARREGKLKSGQANIAKYCEILLDGFAEVGIHGLVGAATGYEKVRAKESLAKILEEFISTELQAWTKTFPLEFYEEIFRLNGWKFDPTSVRRPSVIGHYTNNFIYKRLAPGVLTELRNKEPKVDGRRKKKLFQWLSGDVGHPKLLAHIEAVKSLMKISPDMKTFKNNLNKVYPIIETTELGFEIEKKS